MATSFLWSDFTAAEADLISGASLNSLASGSTVAVGSAISLSTRDQRMRVTLSLASLNVTSTSAFVSLYIVPINTDGSTYPSVPSGAAVVVPSQYWAGNFNFYVLNAAQVQNMEIIIPPGPFKACITNNLGVAFAASGNLIKYRTYNESY
jgi:hypothetical protein